MSHLSPYEFTAGRCTSFGSFEVCCVQNCQFNAPPPVLGLNPGVQSAKQVDLGIAGVQQSPIVL